VYLEILLEVVVVMREMHFCRRRCPGSGGVGVGGITVKGER
jgi:hypothetical protein